MQAQDLHIGDDEAGFLDGRENLGHGGDVTAREDVFVHPGRRHTGAARAVDGMQHGHAGGREQIAHPAEKLRIMIDADMLEHAHGDDAVECFVQIAVVHEADVHHVLQAALAGAGAGQFVLLARQRHAGDAGFRHAGQIKRHAAPAAADVQHLHARPDMQLGGQVALLGQLGFGQGLAGIFEKGAGILPVAVEEQIIEAAIEIIMMGHVAPRPAPWIELMQAAEGLAQHEGEAHAKGGVLRGEGRGGEDIQKLIDTALLHHQGAVHVGLAQAQIGIKGGLEGLPAGGEAEAHRRAGAVAEADDLAAGGNEGQISFYDDLSQGFRKQTGHDANTSPRRALPVPLLLSFPVVAAKRRVLPPPCPLRI